MVQYSTSATMRTGGFVGSIPARQMHLVCLIFFSQEPHVISIVESVGTYVSRKLKRESDWLSLLDDGPGGAGTLMHYAIISVFREIESTRRGYD